MDHVLSLSVENKELPIITIVNTYIDSPQFSTMFYPDDFQIQDEPLLTDQAWKKVKYQLKRAMQNRIDHGPEWDHRLRAFKKQLRKATESGPFKRYTDIRKYSYVRNVVFNLWQYAVRRVCMGMICRLLCFYSSQCWKTSTKSAPHETVSITTNPDVAIWMHTSMMENTRYSQYSVVWNGIKKQTLTKFSGKELRHGATVPAKTVLQCLPLCGVIANAIIETRGIESDNRTRSMAEILMDSAWVSYPLLMSMSTPSDDTTVVLAPAPVLLCTARTHAAQTNEDQRLQAHFKAVADAHRQYSDRALVVVDLIHVIKMWFADNDRVGAKILWRGSIPCYAHNILRNTTLCKHRLYKNAHAVIKRVNHIGAGWLGEELNDAYNNPDTKWDFAIAVHLCRHQKHLLQDHTMLFNA